jgi:hypothetical protein
MQQAKGIDREALVGFAPWMALLMTLNGVDAVCTVYQVRVLGRDEANPLMAALLGAGVQVFVWGKVWLVAACIGVVCVATPKRFTLEVLRLACGVYALVAIYHAMLFLGFGS